MEPGKAKQRSTETGVTVYMGETQVTVSVGTEARG